MDPFPLRLFPHQEQTVPDSEIEPLHDLSNVESPDTQPKAPLVERVLKRKGEDLPPIPRHQLDPSKVYSPIQYEVPPLPLPPPLSVPISKPDLNLPLPEPLMDPTFHPIAPDNVFLPLPPLGDMLTDLDKKHYLNYALSVLSEVEMEATYRKEYILRKVIDKIDASEIFKKRLLTYLIRKVGERWRRRIQSRKRSSCEAILKEYLNDFQLHLVYLARSDRLTAMENFIAEHKAANETQTTQPSSPIRIITETSSIPEG